MKKILILLCSLIIAVSSAPAFGMIIKDTVSAENMAQSLVGSGVEIDNIIFTGSAQATGTFTGGSAAGIGIDSGIVLTSGFASNLDGTTNTTTGITGGNGGGGDADLAGLIPGFSINDATILEFDFKSEGDSAFFSYVFGSEEYNEYVNSSFNDVFGFFFSEIGGSKTNIALVPGSTDPVTIDTVNNDVNGPLYNNNDAGEHPFEYDGFTDVFTAKIFDLEKDTLYHLKLAIADAGDSSLDSGVFLKAGSFSDKPPTDVVPEPTTILLFGFGLLGLAGVSRRKK